MKKINILDDLTVNKIAAGEVVERPSSVAKELIENSIDAESTKITIEIVDGGKKLIRITDNGSGISSSEVEKSFLRHATSKIKNIEDLYDLYSLGFRGEALASISSVSKLEMITKTKEEPVGTKVIVNGGKIVTKEPIGTVNGTTMIIKDIFFNTPARQKFLKSTHAETINISDLINKLAIGNPNIQFKYVNNNKTILATPGDNKLLSVIRSIYGKEICENLIQINYKGRYFQIEGYIGNNNIYRSNRNLQHIYINKRFVKSKMVLDAISESYKGIIPINKHGVCFLDITLNPSSIDVNIHPTKLEIKFENEKELYIELRDYLRKSLINTNLIGRYETYEKKEPAKTINLPIKTIDEEMKTIEIENIEELLVNDFKSLEDSLLVMDKEVKEENVREEFEMYLEELENIELENIELENINLETTDVFNEAEQNKQEEFIGFKEQNEDKLSFNDYNIVGTIFNTYIILSKKESMYLLDQHAAHEKILYEKYMKKFYKSDISMQLLLDPIVLEVSNVDMLKIEKNIKLFQDFGFEIEAFGNNHIMIRSVPTIFGIPESEKFILQIIDNINDITNNYELKGEKFASMACKSAIKANDKIQYLEIKSLLTQLEVCDNPFTCPHGRPTIVEISKNEIEKMFKRIM